MSKLYLTTVELWPAEARRQLRERRISVKRLRERFACVVFPWDAAYGSYRFFYKQEIAEFPLFVVVFTRAAGDREAVRLLDLVHAKHLQLRVISGRHSSAIQNPHVYADISELHGVRLLPSLSPSPPCLPAPISTSVQPRSAPPPPPPLKPAPISKPPSVSSSPRPKSKPTLECKSPAPVRSPPQPRPGIARKHGVTSSAKRDASAANAVGEATSSTDVCILAPIVRAENGRSSRSDESKREGSRVETNVRIEVEGGATQGQVYRYLFECATSAVRTAPMCAATVHFAGGHLVHPSPSLALSIRASGGDGGGGADIETGFPGGSAGSVGANALISCGGIGTLHRTFGLAVDRVESFRIALPPRPERVSGAGVCKLSDRCEKKTETDTGVRPMRASRVVTASATRNRNLFWALRGGQAANFGIILSSVTRTISVGRVLVYGRVMPWSAAYRVLRLWQRTAPQRPRAFNETLSLVCTRARPDDPELSATSSGAADTASAADGGDGDNGTDGSAQVARSPFSTLEGERNVARNVVLSGIYVLGAAETERHAERAVRRELEPFARFGGTSTLGVSDYAATMKRLGDERTYKPFSAIRVVLGRPPLDGAAALGGRESRAEPDGRLPRAVDRAAGRCGARRGAARDRVRGARRQLSVRPRVVLGLGARHRAQLGLGRAHVRRGVPSRNARRRVRRLPDQSPAAPPRRLLRRQQDAPRRDQERGRSAPRSRVSDRHRSSVAALGAVVDCTWFFFLREGQSLLRFVVTAARRVQRPSEQKKIFFPCRHV